MENNDVIYEIPKETPPVEYSIPTTVVLNPIVPNNDNKLFNPIINEIKLAEESEVE